MPDSPLDSPPETPAARLGRLRARSMWRGIREMDLILRDFAARELDAFPPPDLDAYEALLEEPDDLLFLWVGGGLPPPARHRAMVERIRAGAHGIARPG